MSLLPDGNYPKSRGQQRDNMDRDACVQGLYGFLWSPLASEPCWHCDTPCNWIDIGFEARLHPGRCSEHKWDEWAWSETFALLRERGVRG